MDDKTPPKPTLDLKERLRLSGGPSRRAQAREEEEKKALDIEKAEKKQKAVEARARVDQFRLEGPGGVSKSEWSQAVQISEEELAALEAPPKKGRAAKGLVLTLISLAVIAGCLAAGYYFGRAFFGRALENMKIQEAASVEERLFDGDDTKRLFAALTAYKKEIDGIVAVLDQRDVDPMFQLRKVHEFMTYCAKFLETNGPPKIRDILPNRAYNPAPEIIAGALDLIDRIDRLFNMSQTVMLEREVLAQIGTGEEDETEEPKTAYLTFESAPKVEGEVSVPWNTGRFIQITAESKLVYTPPPAPETPETPPGPGTFELPVKVMGETALVAVETGRIVEFDAWPVIRSRENEYRAILMERVRAVLLELQATAMELRWDSFRKALQEQAAKEPYFTL